MRKYSFINTISILLGTVAFLSTVAGAAVTDISCDFKNYEDPGLYNWSFDYDLQQLTITETVLTLDLDVPVFDRKYIQVIGFVDSESIFSVTRTFYNNTGVTWTGLKLLSFAPLPGGGSFVTGNASSTKLQTITFSHPSNPLSGWIEFSDTPVVLDDESIMIQFDFFAPPVGHDGLFTNHWYYEVVPEPTTISSLFFGGLVLLRKRETRKNHKLPI